MLLRPSQPAKGLVQRHVDGLRGVCVRPQSHEPDRSAAMADSSFLHRIRQQYEDRAVAYDQDNTYHPHLAQHLLSLCDLKPGQRLLDLASGTGLVALPAASVVGPTGLVVAVDITEAMLEQSRSKYALSQQPAHPSEQQLAEARAAEVRYVLGDMEDLDSCLPADWKRSFDVITCSAAVPFLRDPTAAIGKWQQWLKQPNGLLVLNAFKAPFVRDFTSFLTLAKAFGLPDEFDPCERLGSEELLRYVLQQAGFRDVQVSMLKKERWFAAPSIEGYCDFVWKMGVNNPFKDPARLQVLDEKQQGLHDALAAAIAHDVTQEGRYDAEKKRVLNMCTVLYAVAKVVPV